MEIIHSPEEVQKKILAYRAEGKTIGFVPTMGALHEGHMSLVQKARPDCDILVMSIFVNPMQFGPSEDLDKYPRTLDADSKLAERDGVDIIFAPSPNQMYPDGYSSTVSCGGITERLEGAARPGHFDGVTTVVLKLFNITLPHFSVFGQKDAQQALVIKKMVRELNVPVEVVVAPTVREEDGLAMSSRNTYLTAEERAEVYKISKGLQDALTRFQQGERNAEVIRKSVEDLYKRAENFTTEYVALTNSECEDLADIVVNESLLSVVCRTNSSGTRLIDNVILT